MSNLQNKIYKYFERNLRLRVLFVFDEAYNLGAELSAMEWTDGYLLHEFAGDWFNTKYVIENEWSQKKVVLVFPGRRFPHQEAEKLDFPLMTTIEQRSTHLGAYRATAMCMRYSDFVTNDMKANCEIFKRPLVYIFHDTIDEAGHAGNPLDVIHACGRSVEQLAALVRSLHATMNVANVILTSDHGFLYNDIRFEEKDKHPVKDSDIEKKTRYYLTTDEAPIEGVVKFPLEKVSGIESEKPVYVGVPKGTNMVFVGNTKHTVPYMLRECNLFESIPTSFIKKTILLQASARTAENAANFTSSTPKTKQAPQVFLKR